MSVAFVDRNPTSQEIEKLRLLMSSYQDGTGMLTDRNGKTVPGWRDFERSVALAFNGKAPENKGLFDVVLTGIYASPQASYGLSCKMRSELRRVGRDGRVAFEVNNQASDHWKYLNQQGFTIANYRKHPDQIGQALMSMLNRSYQKVSVTQGGVFDLSKSYYLVLSWQRDGWYKLFQFSLELFNSEKLTWMFPDKTIKGQTEPGRYLAGYDATGKLVEWYGESGSQLKFYPLAGDAVWESDGFRLEPLPNNTQGLLAKTQAYYPQHWAELERAERLTELKELLDEGLITPEDYDTRRKEILSEV